MPIAKYVDFDFPAWTFIEVVSFGSFLYFYKLSARRFNDREMLNEFYILQAVKSLRNACAHNNCILNNLSAGKPIYEPRHDVMQELSGISSIGPGQRRAKMSNDRMKQIVTTLYAHWKLASRGVSEHRADSLALFAERMNKHVDYYCSNLQVSTGFEFLAKVINAWFPLIIDFIRTPPTFIRTCTDECGNPIP